MSPEKTKQLIQKYPLLYTEATKEGSHQRIAFGFECGDGWFDIIDECSKEIETINDGLPKITASQVKEKFGSIRFYAHVEDEANLTEEENLRYTKALNKLDQLSLTTCETCGRIGQRRNTSWIQVMCDNCFSHYQPRVI